jgi:signal transduction histidine kinase
MLLLHFIGHRAAIAYSAAAYCLLVALFALGQAGVDYAVSPLGVQPAYTLLYRGPLVAAGFIFLSLQPRLFLAQLRKANARLAEALGDARRLMKEREALLRFVCHELRTPLNAVALGFDEVLLSEGAPNEDTVAIVRRQIQSIKSCLDDLLLLSASRSAADSSSSFLREASGTLAQHATATPDALIGGVAHAVKQWTGLGAVSLEVST